MNNLIKKIDSLYNMSNFKYTYKISYYGDLFALFTMNIVGVILLAAAALGESYLIINTILTQDSALNLDNILMVCLINWVFFTLLAICFIHNKSKISGQLIFFGCSWFVLAWGVTLGHLLYQYIQAHIHNQDHSYIFYLDLSLVLGAAIFYVCTHQKFHAFLDKHLTKFER